MIPRIVTARAWHIPEIASRVRPADLEELWSFSCITPAQAMYYGINISKMARTGFVDDEAVCMFGVSTISVVGRVGRPWMVGTTSLDRYSKIFLRRCANVVEEMQEGYDRLENYVDVRNVRAIAWLKWLGFEMGAPQPMGPYGRDFILFSKERRDGR